MIHKSENLLNEKKNVKTTKRVHDFKGYISSYNAEIVNPFNPELQCKDTQSEIKIKLKKLLSELRWFKFVTTLVFVLEKRESKDKTTYDTFHSHSLAETIIN